MMKRTFFYLLFLILFQFGWAQSKLSWQGYFSFNEIKDISESPTAVFAASENALFSKTGTKSIVGLVLYAIQNDLIDAESVDLGLKNA